MLTRDIRDKWASALESGEYEQIRGSLFRDHNPKAYCCLGVLMCGVLGKARIVLPYPSEPQHGNLITVYEEADFITMNDDQELSFPEIAEHVRQLPTSD